MTDRNLFLRAAEGDPEAEREVLARLRRKHTQGVVESREEIDRALMRYVSILCNTAAAECAAGDPESAFRLLASEYKYLDIYDEDWGWWVGTCMEVAAAAVLGRDIEWNGWETEATHPWTCEVASARLRIEHPYWNSDPVVQVA